MKSEIKIHECPECGFTWRHGHNGSHNCATRLKARVKELEATPDHWAESVKMADDMGHEITVHKSAYHLGIFDYEEDKFLYDGPFTLPELHEKLISLRESEGE